MWRLIYGTEYYYVMFRYGTIHVTTRLQERDSFSRTLYLFMGFVSNLYAKLSNGAIEWIHGGWFALLESRPRIVYLGPLWTLSYDFQFTSEHRRAAD